jgi:DNA-binding MarR family transcriptional regulator
VAAVADAALAERDRLRLMTLLCAMEEGDEILLGRLREVLALTPERAATTISRLKAAGYVSSYDGAREGVAGAWITATTAGRAAFRRYLAHLEVELTGASSGR